MVSSKLSPLQHDFVEAFFREVADARTKDAAADPATLAWALSQWRLGPRTPLPEGIRLDDIERPRANLIERLMSLAIPSE